MMTMRMQTIAAGAKAEVASTLPSSLVPALFPSQGSGPAVLTVAVLSNTVPEWLTAMAGLGLRLLCVGADGATLLPQDRPDVLFIDAPFVLSDRRLSLLVTQLRWGRPDLVVVVADGMIGQTYEFGHDLNFDPKLGSVHAADALAVAISVLARRRSGPDAQRQKALFVPLLRRPSVRRTNLFG
jgi:hypothetical protein